MEGIERIKVLASEIKNKATLNVIDYLVSREDMNEKYLNEEKSLKQMVEFIRNNAKKQAQDGIAIIEDSTVYGWAIHYWDESNEDLKLKASNKKLIEEVEEQPIVNNEKTIPKNKKGWVPEGQLSLFDVM